MAPTKVAVAGITGMFGKQVVNALLQYPDVTIHGIARDTSKVSAAISENSQVKLFSADSNDVEGLRAALRGTDICICCYNGPDSLMIDGQRTLIDTCIAERVARYMASDFSFDIRGLNMGDFPFKDFQLKTRDYLAQKEKAGEIKAVHCLNGAFQEIIVSPMIGMIDAESDTFRYWGTGDEPWDMTTVRDSASFVARTALDHGATGFLAVRGDKKSIKEMASIYERVYGPKVTLENHGSLDDLGKKMVSLRQSEPDNVPAWLGLYYNYFTLNGSTLLNDQDLGRYQDMKPKTLEELLEETSKEKLGTLL